MSLKQGNTDISSILIGGSGGTSDYTDLTNKPKINNVTLSGNKTSADLSLANASHTHTSSEITDLDIPTSLSELSDDATHRVVTDTEKSTWNAKQDIISDLATIRSGASLGATALQSESDPVFSASASSGITSSDITNWNNKSDFSGDYDDLTNKPTLFSGDYDDLTNKPTIPTTTSQLTNNSGFITNNVNDLTNYTKTSDLGDLALKDSVDYDTEVTNKPTIPTAVSQLTNDSGFTKGVKSRGFGALNDYDITKIVHSGTIPMSADEGLVITNITTLGNNLTYNYSSSYKKSAIDDLLDDKANTSDLSAVATSGDYDDLSNTPTIPVNSDFTLNGLSEKSYNNLTDKPTIPTDTSDLTNGAGFIDNTYHDSTKVDVVSGKGLSTNDYTTADKNKLDGIDMTTKQDTLVSGTNIKTINNTSLLGSGNIEIQSGSSYTAGDGITINDNEISAKVGTGLFFDSNDEISLNANTQNILAQVSNKQDTLVSGTNIKTINNTSVLGSGNLDLQESSITCYLASNYSYTSSKNLAKLNLTLSSSKGTKLTMTADGGVKIGAGVDRIMVNAQIYYYTGSNHSDGKNVYIYKNSTQMGRGSRRDNFNYILIQGGAFMFDVQENDVIYLYALNDVNGSTVIGNGLANTYMNIITI